MIFIKHTKQTGYQDCGLACISMLISHHYKKNIEINFLKEYLSLSDEEISFYEIINLSQNFSLKAEAFIVDDDFDDLKKYIPFLAQVVNEKGMLHYVIVREIYNNKILLSDPNDDNSKKIEKTTFFKIFNKNVLVFKSHKKEFNNNFYFSRINILNLLDFELVCYLIFTLFGSVILILETKFLQIYSVTLSSSNQSYYIYFYYFILMVVNLLIKKISDNILTSKIEKRKKKLMKMFHLYIKETNNKNSLAFYENISYIVDFEKYLFIPAFSYLISEIAVLFSVFMVSKQIFLLVVIFNIIYFLVSCINNNNKNMEIRNFSYRNLSNINYFKDTCQEKTLYESLFEADKNKDSFSSELKIEFWHRLLMILFFIFSWTLLKNNQLDFSSFFTLLLILGFNKLNIVNIGQTIKQFNKYQLKSILVNKKININALLEWNEEINDISILAGDKKITLSKGFNIINKDLNLRNINKTKKDSNINVYFNNKNIINFDSQSIRDKVIYHDQFNYNFGTIYQNIVKENNGINIFVKKEIKNILNKYNIDISKLIIPDQILNVEKEIIKLLSIFYNVKKVILIKNNFKILTTDEVILILKLFSQINSDNFLVLS